MRFKLLLVLALFTLLSYGQKKIEVKACKEKFSVGTVDAYTVNIYEADVKYVKKSWKKLLKNYSGSVKMGSEIFADDVMIKRMSDNTVDVYTKINEKKDGIVEIKCAVDLGGVFLSKSSHPLKHKEFKKILKDFTIKVSKDAVNEKIKDEEKVLKKIENEQENLVSTKEKLTKEIEKYKQKILDNEAIIEQNLKDQEQKKKDIEAQKVVISGLNDKANAIK